MFLRRGFNMQWKALQNQQASLYSTSSELTAPDLVLETTRVQPEEPCPVSQQKLLRAAIIGVPNAGKTTLINQLLGKKLFAVSPKRHTTTRNAMGAFTEGNSQVILVDTPGVVPYTLGRKLRAPKSFRTGPQRSLMEAELVVVVVDASDKRARGQLDRALVRTLSQNRHVPSVLLLNKVDAVKHKHILLQITDTITESLKEWMQREEAEPPNDDENSSLDDSTSSLSSLPTMPTGHQLDGKTVEAFPEVFMASALTGDGVEDLRKYLLSRARPAPWEYSVTVQSDQSQFELAEDIIREKLFHHLHQEIPYVVKQTNVIWEKEGDTQVIYQNLSCRSSSQASIVIGPAGRTIQTITEEAKTDIEELLGCAVDLTLNVRTQK